jgi:hypothetical protein
MKGPRAMKYTPEETLPMGKEQVKHRPQSVLSTPVSIVCNVPDDLILELRNPEISGRRSFELAEEVNAFRSPDLSRHPTQLTHGFFLHICWHHNPFCLFHACLNLFSQP